MSEKYDEYLDEHIEAVGKAACWMVRRLDIVQNMPWALINSLIENVRYHDEAKRRLAEYGAYDEHFYGDGDNEADFNAAWLDHIHRSPHHWQHWLLVTDDGRAGEDQKLLALEMPVEDALEMVADWWSFSWASGDLYKVFDWYEANRDCMILHPSTRVLVEEVLDEMRRVLDEDGERPERVTATRQEDE